MANKVYRYDLDFLKGIAIIAVVFYHAQLLQSGFLGVELFFVISGFLVLPSLCRHIAQSEGIGYYFTFMKKRIMRLWPLVLIASLVCLTVGYVWGMLPDDFENLSESIVASNLMSNNLLSAITIRDYWAVRTNFQPLMHLWYVGILFEFYLITPLILYLTKYAAKALHLDVEKSFIGVLIVLSAISLAIYLLPSTTDASRFYHLPPRYYELCIGGIIAMLLKRRGGSGNLLGNRYIYYISLVVLFFLIIISLFDSNYAGQGTRIIPIGMPKDIPHYFLFIDRNWIKVLVVALSTLVVCTDGSRWLGKLAAPASPICLLGKMSFSIYIWHQVLLAFERYFYSNEVNVVYVVLFLLATFAISWLTYKWVEGKVKVSNRNLIICAIAAILISGVSYYFYNRAGVTRDVPELGITMKDAKKKMHTRFLKRTYTQFNKGYEDNGKYNVCTIGNSFMSDFVNILKESEYADSVNLIMARWLHYVNADIIAQSDYVFIFNDPDTIPAFISDNIPSDRIFGIGTKNFGDSNGAIYRQRHSENYHNLSFKPHKEYTELNDLWLKKWGADHYINLYEMSLLPNGETRIFTPDHQFMSQDCEHLTQPAARFFAERIDWPSIINSKRDIQRKSVKPLVKK